jgi:CubicO group peptidase (beta-lactamase class C family)
LAETNINRKVTNKTRQEKIAQYLERLESFGFSGAVLVADNGKIVLSKGYGDANKEKNISFTKETVFNIASLTKPFTAAVLRLKQEGKLNTSDTIGKFFENAPEDKKDITIHELLTHTGGLRFDIGGRRENWTRDEVVGKILASKLNSKPGEKYSYSNAGYMLFAALIEKLSGASYENYLEEKFFKPAGMKNTGFTQNRKWNESRIARGYNEWKSVGSFLDWSRGWRHGSGNIVSNLEDVYRWHQVLINNRILSKEKTEKLFAKYVETGNDNFYGYGWFIGEDAKGNRIISHGDNAGYHSEFRWYPETNRTIIVFTNQELYDDSGAGLGLHKRVIASNISRLLKGEKIEMPPGVVKLSPTELKKYEGTYEVEDAGKFRIWLDGNQLKIGADGQAAINLLLSATEAEKEIYRKINVRSTAIIEAINAKNLEKLKEILGESDAKFFASGWFEDWQKWTKEYGVLKSFEILGTKPLPWQDKLFRTQTRLEFEKNLIDFHFTWNDKALYETLSDLGSPHAVVLPLAPETKQRFKAFNLITSKESDIELVVDKKEGKFKVQ